MVEMSSPSLGFGLALSLGFGFRRCLGQVHQVHQNVGQHGNMAIPTESMEIAMSIQVANVAMSLETVKQKNHRRLSGCFRRLRLCSLVHHSKITHIWDVIIEMGRDD